MGALEKWFLENQREFPWRRDRSPYSVWISEVMLQQTRASVVVPYFLRWMEKFPNVKALYNAKIEEVIKVWEGLGYYSRARNLHMAAKQIMEEYGGVIPQTQEDLEKIRGFGPYTVGAILSFAFQKKAVAIDGNVLRVMSRYFCIEEDICSSKGKKLIQEKTLSLLDQKKPWVTSEALIELGAMICSKKPQCELCPLANKCLAREKNCVEQLPIKRKTISGIKIYRSVFVIEKDGHVLVRKGSSGKIMADLFEFPYLEMKTKDILRKKVLQNAQNFYEDALKLCYPLKRVFHTFTKYRSHLFPFLFQAKNQKDVEEHDWIGIDQLSKFPFSSGHKKILSEVEKIYGSQLISKLL